MGEDIQDRHCAHHTECMAPPGSDADDDWRFFGEEEEAVRAAVSGIGRKGFHAIGDKLVDEVGYVGRVGSAEEMLLVSRRDGGDRIGGAAVAGADEHRSIISRGRSDRD